MNILIIDGTSSLGKATVELLIRDEHNIRFSYLTNDEFTKVANKMESLYENVKAIPLNFCESESVDAFCGQIKDWDIDVFWETTLM